MMDTIALLAGSQHIAANPALVAEVAGRLRLGTYEVTGPLAEAVGAALVAGRDPADVRRLASTVRRLIDGDDVITFDPTAPAATPQRSVFDPDATRLAPRRRRPGAKPKVTFDVASLIGYKSHKNSRWRHLIKAAVAAAAGQLWFRHPTFRATDDMWRKALDWRYARKPKRYWGRAPHQLSFWPAAAGEAA